MVKEIAISPPYTLGSKILLYKVKPPSIKPYITAKPVQPFLDIFSDKFLRMINIWCSMEDIPYI